MNSLGCDWTQKAGTTSLANCLKLHPAISGMDGLPWHEALSKESHFFNGVFGPNHASSATLYRSFFPTMLCRWWAEHIRGVKKVYSLTCFVVKWLSVHMYVHSSICLLSVYNSQSRHIRLLHWVGMQLCLHVSKSSVKCAAVAVL